MFLTPPYRDLNIPFNYSSSTKLLIMQLRSNKGDCGIIVIKKRVEREGKKKRKRSADTRKPTDPLSKQLKNFHSDRTSRKTINKRKRIHKSWIQPISFTRKIYGRHGNSERNQFITGERGAGGG